MTQHTPGPWKVGKPTCPGVDGQCGIWAGKRGIADVYGYGHDARLIASAPDMLADLATARAQIATLRDALLDIEGDADYGSKRDDLFMQILKKARAARRALDETK